FVGVEYIVRHEVALAIGVVEISPRIGAIAAGVYFLGSHLGENITHLHAWPVVKARLPQVNHGAVEDQMAPLGPELAKTERLVGLVGQARPFHLESKRI